MTLLLRSCLNHFILIVCAKMSICLALFFGRIKDCCTLRNLLTLTCICLTVILSTEIVVDFLITRPTTTSTKLVNFQSSDFPDLLLCLDPGIKSSVARKYGYNEPAFYWQGRTGNWKSGEFVGWNGENGRQNFSEIFDKFLRVKTNIGLISNFWQYNKFWKMEPFQKEEFRMLRYPYWRCQLIKPSKIRSIEKTTSFINLDLNASVFKKILEDEPTNSSTMLNVLLQDPTNSPLTYPLNFQMSGDRIRVPFKKAWRIFQIRVFRTHHVQGDPNFDCMEYTEENTFGECVQKQLSDIFKGSLNCTPPLMMQKPSEPHVCNQRFHLTRDEGNRIRDLFDQIHFDFIPSVCKRPCTGGCSCLQIVFQKTSKDKA